MAVEFATYTDEEIDLVHRVPTECPLTVNRWRWIFRQRTRRCRWILRGCSRLMTLALRTTFTASGGTSIAPPENLRTILSRAVCGGPITWYDHPGHCPKRETDSRHFGTGIPTHSHIAKRCSLRPNGRREVERKKGWRDVPCRPAGWHLDRARCPAHRATARSRGGFCCARSPDPPHGRLGGYGLRVARGLATSRHRTQPSARRRAPRRPRSRF